MVDIFHRFTRKRETRVLCCGREQSHRVFDLIRQIFIDPLHTLHAHFVPFPDPYAPPTSRVDDGSISVLTQLATTILDKPNDGSFVYNRETVTLRNDQ